MTPDASIALTSQNCSHYTIGHTILRISRNGLRGANSGQTNLARNRLRWTLRRGNSLVMNMKGGRIQIGRMKISSFMINLIINCLNMHHSNALFSIIIE